MVAIWALNWVETEVFFQAQNQSRYQRKKKVKKKKESEEIERRKK